MFIVKYKKVWYTISTLLILASLFAIFFYGLNWGIDFTGGAILKAEYSGVRPELSVLQDNVNGLELGNIILQPAGENGLIVRSRNLSEGEHQILTEALTTEEGGLGELSFNSIGPTIGKELRDKSWTAGSIVVLMIILYIAFAFRKIGTAGLSSFKYGLVAVVALIHDMIIPVGIFAVLGKYLGVEIDILFVTAMLTVFGYSVNDTIVSFDRLRENLKRGIGDTFEETVGISISQTLTRSINTSLTTLFVLVCLYFFGSDSIKYFSLALIIGVISGTYSSIFLATPLLATIYKGKK